MTNNDVTTQSEEKTPISNLLFVLLPVALFSGIVFIVVQMLS